MAVVLDLSDELIILIISNFTKPSHLLQLALANKRIHAIAIQHLYENVVFDRADYPAFPPFMQHRGSGVIRYDYKAPHSNVLHLSNMIRSNTLPAGQTITALTIAVDINNVCNKFQTLLSLLLPQLSSLKHLTLESVSDHRLAWQHEHFSLAPLAVALGPASHTLQSLSMHFFLSPGDSDGWTIGSLRHFSELKYLSVQGNVLLGQYGNIASTMPSLDSVLPPGLKRLRLHWCTMKGIQSLYVVLLDFVKASLRVSRKMEELVVQLGARAANEVDQWNVELFETSLPNMNEDARQGGLHLRMALDWRQDYRWVARSAVAHQSLRFSGKKERKGHPIYTYLSGSVDSGIATLNTAECVQRTSNLYHKQQHPHM
ncbi:hypothetical protein HO173_009706 [Letharia columbiana]|uniref:F-box domain-containing protein n=1 Tax=Letharia columbiana TaxID=112416 RepID=A0A8H6L1I9_9LECA|nr:uncharacterized protein HO173_009706 [Letharia columbiana]KAF6232112.1 hypothetical protein HO173_009706 [Letharia columbiana]